jgi:alpha-tubulin suppressor-like RCC1 family protein
MVGDGAVSQQAFPSLSATSLSLSSSFGCSVSPTAEVQCWGLAVSGALGGPSTTSLGMSPCSCVVAPTDITPGVAVATGGWWSGTEFACALGATATVTCWGTANGGQLGPVPDAGTCNCGSGPACACGGPTLIALPPANEVAADHNGACARVGGEVYCWGGDIFGPGQAGPIYTPEKVPKLTDAVALGAGGDFFCALRADATVACWGSNFVGQLGNGTLMDSMNPVPVSGLSNIAEIACGYTHACARTADGDVWCWGSNDRGQLGNDGASQMTVQTGFLGAIPSDLTPEQVAGVSGVIELASTDGTVYARTADGALYGWGDDKYGQLNAPGGANALTPVLLFP